MRRLRMKLAGALGAAVLVGAVIAPGAGADMTLYERTNLLTTIALYLPSGMAYDRTNDTLYVAGASLFGSNNGMLHRFDSNRVETAFGATSDYRAVAVDSHRNAFGLTKANQLITFDKNQNQTGSFDAGGGAIGGSIAVDSSDNVFVAAPAAVTNEKQAVTLPSGAGGTFTLTFEGQTTSSISATATANAVRNALQALSTIGSGNVAVQKSGTTYNVTFQGKFAGSDVPSMSVDNTFLTGGAATVTTITPGSTYPTAGVREFSSSGTLEQVIDCSVCPSPGGFATPSGVAFDAGGNMYVSDSTNQQVVKLTPSGGDPTDYTAVPPVAFGTGAAEALAVDPVTGDFFVGGDDGSGYHVKGFRADGTQFADFGLGDFENIGRFLGLPDQIAVDPVSGHVFVGDTFFTEDFHSAIWEFAPVFPPTATVEAASEIGQSTATIAAQVNPSGNLVTECHFEYGPDTSYGQSADCAEYPGFGEDPVAVSAEISGLAPDTTYHYKVVVANEAGGAESGDETFTTLIEKAVATTGAASGITQSAATISGSVNPQGNPVEACRFEYGTTTAYGKQAACPTNPGSGSSNVAESLTLSSLLPNTTYHYRIVAVNAGGTTNGADASFTTLPKLPAVNTGAASKITAIEAKLAGSVNPEGSATTYRFEYGASTAYGKSTPAGKLSGTETKAVSTLLSGLAPATTYHYRLVATNAGGTANGADQTFTTSARPIGQVEIPATAPVKHGKAQVSLTCKGLDIAICEGTLTLRARLKQGIRFILVKIGSADFQISGGVTETVSVPLNGNGRKALAQAEGKPLKAVVSAGGANRQLRLFAKHRKRHG